MSQRELVDYEISRLSYRNKKDQRKLRQLHKRCDDTDFEDGYECSRHVKFPPGYELCEGPPNYLYVAIDPRNGDIVGFLETSFIRNENKKIDAIWLRLLSAKTKKYRGIGTRLMNELVKDAKQDKRIHFILVPWGGGEAVGFYLKKGFKLYGATGKAVYKIIDYPDINRIRHFDMSVAYGRLFYSKKQDNIKRWERDYGSLAEASDLADMPVKKAQVLLFKDFSDVKLFPDHKYKYGRKVK